MGGDEKTGRHPRPGGPAPSCPRNAASPGAVSLHDARWRHRRRSARPCWPSRRRPVCAGGAWSDCCAGALPSFPSGDHGPAAARVGTGRGRGAPAPSAFSGRRRAAGQAGHAVPQRRAVASSDVVSDPPTPAIVSFSRGNRRLKRGGQRRRQAPTVSPQRAAGRVDGRRERTCQAAERAIRAGETAREPLGQRCSRIAQATGGRRYAPVRTRRTRPPRRVRRPTRPSPPVRPSVSDAPASPRPPVAPVTPSVNDAPDSTTPPRPSVAPVNPSVTDAPASPKPPVAAVTPSVNDAPDSTTPPSPSVAPLNPSVNDAPDSTTPPTPSVTPLQPIRQ